MEKKLRILAAADLHGDKDIVSRLVEKARKQKVDLVLLAGDIYGELEGKGDLLKPFKKAKQKVLFVPGNWDFDKEILLLDDRKEIRNIDNYYVTYDGVGIAGLGSPNFRLSLDDEKDFHRIRAHMERMKTDKKILVSHLHAEGTKAEFSGVRGETALRRAIEEFQPDFFLASHIHEAEGIEERIGKTKVIQLGRRGKVIEI
jgi:Icc-related predicted phosphoesterase